jgi:hypothetical protein
MMSDAFGGPGLDPRWTSGAKDGIGTANAKSAMVWFTLGQGVVTEVYFPHVDTPNTRELQYLVTDGLTFCHEKRRDLIHQLEYPEAGIPLYRLVNSEPNGRYQLVKEILVAPDSSVLLVHTRLEIGDPALRNQLRLYALLVPHVAGAGKGNSAECSSIGGHSIDRPEPVFRRYVLQKASGRFAIWTLRHRTSRLPAGKTLRIVTDQWARIRWTFDDWQHAQDMDAAAVLGCRCVGLPTANLQPGACIAFTILWERGWEGRNFAVSVV